MAAAISLRTQKGRPPKRAPFSVLHPDGDSHLRSTLLGRVIPRAASLIATSFVGCRRRVLSEGRASEGECQSQSKSRNKHFHDFTPLLLLGAAITPAGREMFRADCGKLRVSRTALPAARSI